jgi:hypothetical protein
MAGKSRILKALPTPKEGRVSGADEPESPGLGPSSVVLRMDRNATWKRVEP